MKRKFIFFASIVLVCGTTISAHADMIDRGGGLIYDTDLDVTWLQDLNYAMTSGYDADGLMTWYQANIWAANLEIAGYDDWRLPTFDPENARPPLPTDDNEIGSLLLELSGGDHTIGFSDDISPFINLPFQVDPENSDAQWYWTSLLGVGADVGEAWRYSLECG